MAVASEIILSAFERSKVIPVFYHDDPEVCCEVMQACYDGGIRVFEFTNRGENARRNFSIMRDRKLQHMPDMYRASARLKTQQTRKHLLKWARTLS
ncbi:hypothetical protein MKQ70_20850 [Chitinophaga sedimenti]|uniref:hypothetical protein n=1 Tax=Chitinophaga sedimenti TaxID=2033606 RepID=UPI0020030FCE|nr:hypothetical protein [Chitinophaga sedimenti]MCK7557318.1 hypothetical protein [Chitinophaga sedimenti]